LNKYINPNNPVDICIYSKNTSTAEKTMQCIMGFLHWKGTKIR